jgi:histidyl-tRNA synthetase
LDDDSNRHFAAVRHGLDAAGIAYVINPRLVRGLDYYTRTVFEWTTDRLGAQGTVCAGGRYDGLVAQLGGNDTPATGFAMGVERVVQLCRELARELDNSAGFKENRAPHAYLCWSGDAAYTPVVRLAEALRAAGIRVLVNGGNGGFKAQFKRADRSGALFAVVVGDEEVANGTCQIKALRAEEPQQAVAAEAVGDLLKNRLGLPE